MLHASSTSATRTSRKGMTLFRRAFSLAVYCSLNPFASLFSQLHPVGSPVCHRPPAHPHAVGADVRLRPPAHGKPRLFLSGRQLQRAHRSVGAGKEPFSMKKNKFHQLFHP